jgi:hypothetical protein
MRAKEKEFYIDLLYALPTNSKLLFICNKDFEKKTQ